MLNVKIMLFLYVTLVTYKIDKKCYNLFMGTLLVRDVVTSPIYVTSSHLTFLFPSSYFKLSSLVLNDRVQNHTL